MKKLIRKNILLIVATGIIITIAMLLFFDMTVPQMLLNIGCVVVMVIYLVFRAVKPKNTELLKK